MEPVPCVRMFTVIIMATTDQSAIKLLKVPLETAREELSIKSCRGEVSMNLIGQFYAVVSRSPVDKVWGEQQDRVVHFETNS